MLGRGTAVEGQHSESPHEEKPSKREGSGALRRVGRPVGVRCGRVAVSVIDPAVARSGENRKASRGDVKIWSGQTTPHVRMPLAATATMKLSFSSILLFLLSKKRKV